MKNRYSLGTLILTFLLDSGVFEKAHVGPCLVVIEPEPCPDPEYIQVYLYTRKSITKGQYIEFSEKTDNLTSSNFNPKHPTKIINHGFNTDMYLDVLQNIKAEYLKEADMNIFMANYPKLVEKGFCYITAVVNIEHVGKCLAQLVTALRRHQSNKLIHIIGFSLGGQVPNYIAKSLKGNKLDRITGLDPAGPGFTMMDRSHRLDPSDAKFVDVIHTNAGVQGDIQRCGHIDFYMNGGVTQPGCIKDGDFLTCNHRRAPIYFAESINSKVGFYGWPCKGYVAYIRGKCKPKTPTALMGDHCAPGDTGFYIVNTASEKPFALGNKTLPIESFYKRLLQHELNRNEELYVSLNDPVQRIFLDIYLIKDCDNKMKECNI